MCRQRRGHWLVVRANAEVFSCVVSNPTSCCMRTDNYRESYATASTHIVSVLCSGLAGMVRRENARTHHLVIILSRPRYGQLQPELQGTESRHGKREVLPKCRRQCPLASVYPKAEIESSVRCKAKQREQKRDVALGYDIQTSAHLKEACCAQPIPHARSGSVLREHDAAKRTLPWPVAGSIIGDVEVSGEY